MMSECLIWGTEAKVADIGGHGIFCVDSPRAGGMYQVSIEVGNKIKDLNEYNRKKLTTWIIEQRKFGDISPVITFKTLDFISQKKLKTVNERLDNILLYFYEKSESIGKNVYVGEWEYNDFPHGKIANISMQFALAHSESSDEEEIDFLTDTLISQGKIGYSTSYNDNNKVIVIQSLGYEHIADLSSKHVISSQAFVAMWFDPSMNDAYENGIKAAIECCGYKAMKVDEQEYLGPVPDKIIAEIRRSRFLIADFTYGEKKGIRGGVYYEAGFAYGLNIPVIYTCKSGLENELHFDTRHLNHIIWKDPKDLCEKLAYRIAAVIGDGPSEKKEHPNYSKREIAL